MTVALVAGEAGTGVRPDGVRTVSEHVTGPDRKKRILKQCTLIKIKGNFPHTYIGKGLIMKGKPFLNTVELHPIPSKLSYCF